MLEKGTNLKDLVLDIQRAIFLFRVSLKFSIGPIIRHLLRLPQRGDSFATRIRLAMEELGLTYLKLGQYMAMRFDLLPPEICNELSKLFESVSPMSFEEARSVVEVELGGPLESLYSSFNREPVASASVGQVHEARTHANERVAVKVQRPGIQHLLMADLRNLRRVAVLINASGVLGRLSAVEIAEQFAGWTIRELDFIIEANTAERVRKNAMSYEIVPKIYWELTTSKVLTLEFLEGLSLSKLSQLVEEGGINRVHAYLPNLQLGVALHHFAFGLLGQMFVNGLFHGDPHPGNILIRDDNTVAFIDFGIFGELAGYDRDIIIGQIENIAIGNIDESLRYYSKQLIPTDETDLRVFQQEAKTVLTRWYQVSRKPDTPIEERHLGRCTTEMINISRRNQMLYDMGYLLFWRALNSLDAALLRLSDHSNSLVDELRDFFGQTRPGFAHRVLGLMTDQHKATAVAELVREKPYDLMDILNGLDRGHYKCSLYIQESLRTQRANDANTKWMTAGVLGISLAVLAISTSFSVPIRILIIGLAILLFIFSFAEVRDR